MSDTTPHLKLPTIWPSQAQKHVTVNEALAHLDALVQLSVLDRDLTGPPSTPADGDRYIVAAAATGVWTGKEGNVAAFLDGAWTFFPPERGWTAWIADEATLVYFDGAAWVNFTYVAAATGTLYGINTTADATNRLAVKSDAVLLSHDDVTPGSGDIRVKLNKDGASDTASLIYQTGFSGRAEFGLAGDDDFHVKVSADGAAWHEAIIVDRASGRVSFPAGGDGLPVGSVIWHAASTPPSGFLKANGAAISRSTYAGLFSVIGTTYGVGNGSTTFNLPDLRGEFVRGLDDGRGVDVGRVLGSAQAQALPPHAHLMPLGFTEAALYLRLHPTAPNSFYGTSTPTGSIRRASVTHSGVTTETATRQGYTDSVLYGGTGPLHPRNVALLACIKY